VNSSQVFGEAKQLYDQLDPQQRQAVVQQFQQHFGGSADPQLQQQAQSLDPNDPDPQQLGRLHDYAQANAPGALDRAMDHPDIRSAMSQQGVTDRGGGQDPGGYQQGDPFGEGSQFGQDDPSQRDQGGSPEGPSRIPSGRGAAARRVR
jgi:hypothetical protein